MRVLLVSDVYLPRISGLTTAVARQARALGDQGCAVAIAAPQQTNSHDESDLRVFRLPALRFGSRSRPPAAVGSGLRRVLATFRPDIIHAHTPFALGQAARFLAARERLPLLYTHHFLVQNAMAFLPVPVQQSRVSRLASERVLRRAVVAMCRDSDLVIAPSKFAANLVRSIAGREVEVVSNGIPVPLLGPVTASPGFSVVYIGRHSWEKGLETLLYATALARPLLPQLSVVIAGSGALRPALTRMAQELRIASIVSFPGAIREKEKDALLRNASVACQPGEYELQGLSALEAMSYGVPVVACNAAALPETIGQGVCGLLFPPGSASMLADCLGILQGDPALRGRLGVMARKVAEGHDLETIAGRLRELYDISTDRRWRQALVVAARSKDSQLRMPP